MFNVVFLFRRSADYVEADQAKKFLLLRIFLKHMKRKKVTSFLQLELERASPPPQKKKWLFGPQA